MQQNHEPNIAHILDECERINILILANIFYILVEKDERKAGAKRSPLNESSVLKEFEQDNELSISNSSDLNIEVSREVSRSNQPFGIPLWATQKFAQLGLKEEIANLRNKIDTKIKNSPETKENLRLLKLKQLFDLSSEEIDIFLICLIREFDAHYQTMWGNLQNDPDKKYPSIEIILNLLSSNLVEKLKIKSYLQSESNLFKYGLLECTDSRSCLAGLTLEHTVKVSPRIFNYLLGDGNVTPYLSHILELLHPSKAIEDLYLPKNVFNQINTFASKSQALFTSRNTSIISLRGKEGSGQQIIAEGICQLLKINMLVANIDSLLAKPLKELSFILSSIKREAILQNAAIYWQNTYLLGIDGQDSVLHLFVKQLSKFQGLHFFALNPNEYFPFHQSKSTLIHLDIPNLTTNDRFNLWQRVIPKLSEQDIAEIAQSFQLGLGQIYDIATHVQALFRANKDKLSKEQVYQICHTHAYQHLSRYAKLATPLYKLENIILPQECKQELEEIISWMKYKEMVYEKGGFSKKVSLGKGLITMFFGPPGTGKTMAAEVIANTLDLLLYKIDLPSVLSKYIGETEQHLDKVFNEAENSNAILFFDEADSLFGKRGEVKDASDNYANIQTSYLLQKVEDYPGIVILSTNFKHNVDEAFVRRLHFSVEFPFPKPEQRQQIWQQIWPQNVELNAEIDLQKLADKIDIAGGNIKNIALAAAFKAIADQTIKEMPIKVNKGHLIFAIEREFRKIGRIIVREQLNKIFEIDRFIN